MRENDLSRRVTNLIQAHLPGSLQEGAARLQNEIETQLLRQGLADSHLADTLIIEANAPNVTLRCAAPHAVLVEFGTHRTPARPFMTPAYEAGQGAVVRHVAQALSRVIA